jgi:sporulation protein YlmC with PRC-barrel domain
MRRADVDVNLGTPVYSQDDVHVGKVDRVVVPESGGSVQSLVVHKGHFFTHDVLVPLTYVHAVDDDGVHLSLTEDQLDRLPDFIEEEYAPSPLATAFPTYSMGGVMFPLGVEPGVAPVIVDEVKDLPPGAEDIARGYTVLDVQGTEVGTVRDVQVDAARAAIDALIIELIIERQDGANTGDEQDYGLLRVPASVIAHVANEVVTLSVSADQLVAGHA